MSPDVAKLMLGMAVLWLVYQFALRMVTCTYCGGRNTHDEHCPFNIAGGA